MGDNLVEDLALKQRFQFLGDIAEELGRAYAKHGCVPWGRHEFYAILLEEVEELWGHDQERSTIRGNACGACPSRCNVLPLH